MAHGDSAHAAAAQVGHLVPARTRLLQEVAPDVLAKELHRERELWKEAGDRLFGSSSWTGSIAVSSELDMVSGTCTAPGSIFGKGRPPASRLPRDAASARQHGLGTAAGGHRQLCALSG